jgi:hypothetical protein
MDKIGDFKLPKPEDTGKEYIWQPLVRVGRWIPWGYEQDPNDPDILLPVPDELELLEQAKKHLKKYSYRDVALWLSEQSGRSISHVGLMKRIKLEYKRKTEAANSRYLAQRYKEALKKAEEIEKNAAGYRVCARTGETYTD